MQKLMKYKIAKGTSLWKFYERCFNIIFHTQLQPAMEFQQTLGNLS